MKKYQKLAEIYSKNLENHEFLVYHPSNNGHVTGHQSLKSFENCVKVVEAHFDKTFKERY